MRAMTSASGLAISILMLGGCASMHDKSMTQTPVSSQGPTIDIDYAYIAKIEQQARQRNVGIQWVNPPSRHTSASTDRH